jgi:hypothetical protein
MQNSSVVDGLISYILKPRENNCTLSLWVAERVAERRLLQKDGIEMSEDTWLELVLSFVTSEERQTLRVPARDQRARNGEHEGYDVVQLQEALAVCDSENFKRFRQTNCTDPVAARVLSIDRLLAGPNEKAKKGNKPESHSLELPEANALNKPPPAGVAKASNKVPALPQKEGQPDKEVHAKFAVGSLDASGMLSQLKSARDAMGITYVSPALKQDNRGKMILRKQIFLRRSLQRSRCACSYLATCARLTRRSCPCRPLSACVWWTLVLI